LLDSLLQEIGQFRMAEAIVTTLKAKIKANDEELQMFQEKAEDLRAQLNNEVKEREDAEAELNNAQRKLKMIEEKIEKNDERNESISRKLQSASDHFAESDDRRQHVETQFQSTGDKLEMLERQVAEAKRIAEESDAKCEEIVRKLVLGEHHKDRAEERAARSDAKISMLESELGGVNKTMKSLSIQGDDNGKREEDLEEEIKSVKERFRDAEVKAEMAERTVQKLQTEIDRMENALLAEKGKKTRMEEDMEHLMQSIGDI